ncbi:MAG: hypothetical protein Q9222_005935, partial [Ikaeria aurantiellina]
MAPDKVKSEIKSSNQAHKAQQPKKKKKHGPERQQPEWMFPPDEDNPILNPKLKSAEELLEKKEEWEAAVKFLKHRAHSAPVKTAPPKQLLTLVGAFLTSYGFNNTCRIYQLQCSARSRLDGWDSVLGEPLPKDFPNLVKIYKDWFKTYEEKKRMDETSSSDTGDEAPDKEKESVVRDAKVKGAQNASVVKAGDASSSGNGDGSSDSTDSDTDMEDAKSPPKPIKKRLPSPSTSSSSSNSDADDENDTAGLGAPLRKPTVNGLINKLKRKKSPSPSSSSSSGSSSSEDEPASKKAKKADAKQETLAKPIEPLGDKTLKKPSAAKNPSSESSTSNSQASRSSSSSSESESSIKPTKTGSKAPAANPTPKKPALSSSSSSESESESTSSSSDSDSNKFTVPKLKTKQPLDSKLSSDSSVTLVPPTPRSAKQEATADSSSSSSSVSASTSSPDPPSKTATAKTPKTKHSNDRFTRVPPTTTIPPTFASNAYRPYDYADRAHQDLSVTKGKGFIKEKNKKKRG